ncbi:MAG: dTDP-4-dehydrorhamnose reductase [Lachnospira sp.]
MKRVWITGAAGHVGAVLPGLLDETEYEMFLTDKDVDVTDVEAVLKFCHINRPDVIINCASITNVRTCEDNPDEAYRVNAIGVRNIALAANEINAKVIQLSTDDIFGIPSKKPYVEFDEPCPVNVYGKSKLAGEKLLTQLMNRFVIIRSSWVYGIGKDFVNTVLSAVNDNTEIFAADNIYSSPTNASDLANVIRYFIDSDEFGIYHSVCKGSCSRYEFVNAILEYSENVGKIKVTPVEAEEDRIDGGVVLDNMMLRISGLEQPREWRIALKEYLDSLGGETQ